VIAPAYEGAKDRFLIEGELEGRCGGVSVVLEAGPEPRIIARNPLDERVIASPAIAGDRIFVRTDHYLVAIGN